MNKKTEVKYKKVWALNEDGRKYGEIYTITGPKDKDFLELQSELIEDVIGIDRYYSNRDVWDQIIIRDGR